MFRSDRKNNLFEAKLEWEILWSLSWNGIHLETDKKLFSLSQSFQSFEFGEIKVQIFFDLNVGDG